MTPSPRRRPLEILSPLHRATRQIGIYLEEPMSGLGLRGSEAHVLAFLAHYAPCPIHELGRVFGLKRSTLTSLLDRLEGRGLLLRELDESDRRSFLVRPTGEGRKLAQAVGRAVRTLESRVLAGLSKRDLDGFRAVMAAIGETTGIEVRTKEKR